MQIIVVLLWMKCAVYFSAGIGDAVLLIPLLKKLKASGYVVDGVFTSPFDCEALFRGSGLLQNSVRARGRKRALLFTALKQRKKYASVFLNMFATTRTNLLAARIMACRVICFVPERPLSFTQRVGCVQPLSGMHDATQNLRLLDAEATDADLHPGAFRIKPELPDISIPTKRYFTLQLSAGNNVLRYKNWPVDRWIAFLRRATAAWPGHSFILLGDANETGCARKVLDAGIAHVHSVSGKTDVAEAMAYIHRSDCFIGLDGGLMHLAAALGKPSFTLWGISDPQMYGYEMIAPGTHRVLKAENPLTHSWLKPLADDELKKSHYLDDLQVDFVFDEFVNFARSIHIS
ncbi:MAG: glycosyltransferase family 9 protein [Flavobacteriales bacterium]